MESTIPELSHHRSHIHQIIYIWKTILPAVTKINLKKNDYLLINTTCVWKNIRDRSRFCGCDELEFYRPGSILYQFSKRKNASSWKKRPHHDYIIGLWVESWYPNTIKWISFCFLFHLWTHVKFLWLSCVIIVETFIMSTIVWNKLKYDTNLWV